MSTPLKRLTGSSDTRGTARTFLLSRHRVGSRVLALLVVVVALMASSPSLSSAASSPSASPSGSAPATPGSQVCAGPLVITTGGTYSGCWVANHQGTAVTIATSAPVIITNSTIEGTTTLVSNSVGHVKVAIDHTQLYGLYPGGTNTWGGHLQQLWDQRLADRHP